MADKSRQKIKMTTPDGTWPFMIRKGGRPWKQRGNYEAKKAV
jgi:hypothetical protein